MLGRPIGEQTVPTYLEDADLRHEAATLNERVKSVRQAWRDHKERSRNCPAGFREGLEHRRAMEDAALGVAEIEGAVRQAVVAFQQKLKSRLQAMVEPAAKDWQDTSNRLCESLKAMGFPGPFRADFIGSHPDVASAAALAEKVRTEALWHGGGRHEQQSLADMSEKVSAGDFSEWLDEYARDPAEKPAFQEAGLGYRH